MEKKSTHELAHPVLPSACTKLVRSVRQHPGAQPILGAPAETAGAAGARPSSLWERWGPNGVQLGRCYRARYFIADLCLLPHADCSACPMRSIEYAAARRYVDSPGNGACCLLYVAGLTVRVNTHAIPEKVLGTLGGTHPSPSGHPPALRTCWLRGLKK